MAPTEKPQDLSISDVKSVWDLLKPKPGCEEAVSTASNTYHTRGLLVNIPVVYTLGNLVHMWGQGNWVTLGGHYFAGLNYSIAFMLRKTEGESENVRQKEAMAACCHLAAAMPKYLEHKQMKFGGASSWLACCMSTYYVGRWYMHYITN